MQEYQPRRLARVATALAIVALLIFLVTLGIMLGVPEEEKTVAGTVPALAGVLTLLAGGHAFYGAKQNREDSLTRTVDVMAMWIVLTVVAILLLTGVQLAQGQDPVQGLLGLAVAAQGPLAIWLGRRYLTRTTG